MSAKQLGDDLAVGPDRHWAAGAVIERGFRTDAKLFIQRNDQVLGTDGPILRDLSACLDAADDSACANPPPAVRTLMTLPQWSRPGRVGRRARPSC